VEPSSTIQQQVLELRIRVLQVVATAEPLDLIGLLRLAVVELEPLEGSAIA
jgi:hypothetical protein